MPPHYELTGAAEDPTKFAQQTLNTIKASRFKKGVGGDDSDGEPTALGSALASILDLELLGYPAWVVVGIIASTSILLYSLYQLTCLVWYPGRPTRAEIRPNVTQSIFSNPNISFADRAIQFFFPLLLAVSGLCWEGEGDEKTGPTPEMIEAVRKQAQGLSEMGYNPVVPDMSYEVTTVKIKSCDVLLHTPVPFDPSLKFERLPPLIVWCHGGGLTIGGSRDASLADFMRLLTQHNMCAGDTVPPMFASVNYRLAPEHKFPAPIEDVYEVLKFYAEGVGKTHSSMHVAGVSAGAYLALTAMKRAVEGNIKIDSVFAQEPMMEFTGEHESEFVNAYTRTCPPRWLKWCWDVYKEGIQDCDVYTGLNESGWWKKLGKNKDAPRFVVSVGSGDPMCGAAERLIGFMKDGTGLNVETFKTRASHACAVCDGATSEKIVNAFADNIFGDRKEADDTEDEEDSDDSFDE
ncbi:hypothetical protein TrST_g6545 [Triparma strigata]|uniref:Alpha/beta hydrolase fold-3 domain-containing protein n=1 Tax=Triparma strigata TaxID=1606541 RepID=A0A9W7EGL7_9STRA|nr:hypothetical protein TrST_g6545 [Triparma strigata]